VSTAEPQIIVEFSDYTRWSIPARVVAENRAAYYAEVDPEFDRKIIYFVERNYTLANDDVLIEWAKGSMNWADLKHRATQLPTDPLLSDYDQEWSNADMKVER